MEREKVVFIQKQAPGDNLVMTTALRELHLQYPNKFKTAVFTYYPEIYNNNPFVDNTNDITGYREIKLDYVPYLRKAHLTGKHFTSAFIDLFNEHLGLRIQNECIYPDIFLSDEEKSIRILDKFKIEEPYWIINAGFKNDIPLKAYPESYWQKIVNLANDNGIKLIQVGSKMHNHPYPNNVQSLVGQTEDLRDYFSLVYHSIGGIGGISLQMHVAAAFRKPYIVLAGGREDKNWEAYPNHQFFHTVGMLDCCLNGGCWKSQRKDCLHLDKYPLCLQLINPIEVFDKIKKITNRC